MLCMGEGTFVIVHLALDPLKIYLEVIDVSVILWISGQKSVACVLIKIESFLLIRCWYLTLILFITVDTEG